MVDEYRRFEDDKEREEKKNEVHESDDPNKFVLSSLEIYGYSVGHIHNDVCAAIWFSYTLFFFEFVLLFSAKVSGALLFIGQVADAIATVVIGLESDKKVSLFEKYGKRKFLHLFGTIFSALTFPFIFQKCYGGENADQLSLAFYYSILIIIFQFSWATIQINHLSLATYLSPYSYERVKLNSRRSLFTVVSNIVVYLFTWFILRLNSNSDSSHQFSPKDLGHFKIIVLSMTGFGLVFSLIFHLIVKEKSHNIQIANTSDSHYVDFSNRDNHLKWKHWFTYPIFYQVLILYMASRLVINLLQVFIPLYLHYSLKLEKESLAYIPLVIFISGFFASICLEIINKKLKNTHTFLIGCLILLGTFAWILFGYGESFIHYQIYIVSILLGITCQTLNINSVSILNDMIGQNTASAAFVFGIMSFMDKLSNGLSIMTIQYFKPDNCHINFYRYVLTFVCGGSSLLALIMLLSILPHNFSSNLQRRRLTS